MANEPNIIQLPELFKRRGNMKTRITGLTKRIDNLDLVDITDEILIELRDRLSPFQLAYKEYETIKELINMLITDEDGNVDQIQFDEMQRVDDSYYALLSTVKHAIARAEGRQANSRVSSPTDTASQQTNIVVQQSQHGIKLPTIELPKFKGTYENWLEYRDTFKSLIHTNGAITNMQRFHYLRASLIGDAAHIIKSIEFSEQNYITAWDLLCSRFDNSSLLIHNHIKALFGIETVRRESSDCLRALVDNISKHVGALSILGQPTDAWDTLIIYIISGKLDTTTAREWESNKKPNIMPTLKDFTSFLKKRADLLETIELTHISNVAPAPSNRTDRTVKLHPYNREHNRDQAREHNREYAREYNRGYNRGDRTVRTLQTYVAMCTFCQGEHFVLDCETLKALPIADRVSAVMKLRLCINCLRPKHHARECRSTYSCKVCHGRHHSFLHLDRNADKSKSEVSESSKSVPTTSTLQCAVPQTCSVLPTVIALMADRHGNQHTVRVLLDSASQANFVTTELVSRLGLDLTSIDVAVTDFNEGSSRIKNKCEISVKSRTNDFILNTTCFVAKQLTGVTPCFKIRNLTLPPHLRLADPQFFSDRKLDILIGTENFWELLCVGQHSLGRHQPTLQKTRFGWILAGSSHPPTSLRNVICNSTTASSDVQEQLAKFWELEECKRDETSPNENDYCDTHFVETHKRDPNDGRFIVTIPLKNNIESIGDSYKNALKRFLALEHKLESQPDLRSKYNEFIKEYCDLGHMSNTTATNYTEGSYFLPHHAVINNSSTTTKVRVVFDGSAHATCGRSINDFQYVGPTIQSDLLSILLRFREKRYVVTADIAKMYRQVMVNPSQRKLQQIIWRDHPDDSLKSYTLNTVTYGTAAASFLAIRCLNELANEIHGTNPNLSNSIRNDFYVDDLMIGFNSRDDAIHHCNEIADTLKQGCFPLRKWKSNDLHILQSLSGKTSSHSDHDFGNDDLSKSLGLFWSPTNDTLTYKIQSTTMRRVTKRNILSTVASIFDPLGLVAPFTISAKIFLQSLWKENLSWDESLPSTLNTEWFKLNSKLVDLNEVTLARHALIETPSRVNMHGFCDASKLAYGACIYLVSESSNGKMISNILCAKSKVAPIKQQSIPRLELCAALLLAQLYSIVKSATTSEIKSTTLWSDSTIVLSWLKSEPLTLKTFVCNRVTQIKSQTSSAIWRHVGTNDNPADIASRGISAKELSKHELWWHGPAWLSQPKIHWPATETTLALSLDDEETELLNIQCNVVTIPHDLFHVNNYSQIRRLQRVVAYCFRFITNLGLKMRKENPNLGALTVEELEASLMHLVKVEQHRAFITDIETLRKQRHIANKSNLLPLSPFLDNDGLLRVGGRLRKSLLPYSVKHPIVLPTSSHLTKLIIRQEHSRLYHAGPLSLLHSIRQKFWPIRGRDIAKRIVNDCIVCRRANPYTYQPKMGDLPIHRISQAFPFQHTGVDYAGPFTLKSLRGRGGKLYKAYVALFVCFATRALHLELVTDLSTSAFIACLRRFVSRRGRPSHIYSDNGTNFVGAKRTLSEISKFLKETENELVATAANDNISWKFIPARAPNFGGLWEAGVKSVKFHLKRVILDRALTYEDFYTALVQIEAILNSRPITPMSTDPNDESPLTPAHLLIGRTMNTVPDLNVLEIPEMRFDSYQRTQSLVQGFWRRWHHDYLNQLQLRSKWKTDAKYKVQVGDLVTLNDNNLPPSFWKTGRIVELHPGDDGITRVVSLKTAKGIMKRAVNKISPLLPLEKNEKALT